MSTINLMRTNLEPPNEAERAVLNRFMAGFIDGFSRDDKRAWRRFLKRLMGLEPGEMALIEAKMPRSGKFHRYHMALEQRLFDAQERFTNFEMMRYWIKVGAGWVTWAAGPKGGVVPIPKSISFAKADDEEFRRYHDQVVEFLRGPHAAKYLWPHLSDEARAEMMAGILTEFEG